MTRRYEREILELVERKEREHRGRERVQRARRTVDKARHRVSPVHAWERLGAITAERETPAAAFHRLRVAGRRTADDRETGSHPA